MITHPIRFLLILIMFLLVVACRPTATLPPEGTPSPTLTLSPPTETAIPLAALVNGEAITMDDFETELARFHDSRGTDLATESSSSEVVLQALIDRLLLAQSARSIGIVIGENELDAEIARLIDEMGGENNYLGWLQENHFTTTSFRQAMGIEMQTTKMIDEILSSVPESERQAHAQHILVASQQEAEGIRQEIIAGADFAELAVLYSLDLSTKPAGGDLGWFATGTLTAPSVEEVVFQLQPGNISEVIASEFGYHIVQLIALEDRALSYETLLARQEQAVENWLTKHREQADIEVYINA